MKTEIKQLKTNEISSEVFVISPSQIDFISASFSNAMAEAMNLKSLSYKIRQLAAETLTKTLQSAKTMGCK